MNDQPSPYDAVIADLRSKRDQIDALIQSLETFKAWVPPGILGGAVEPSILGGASATGSAGTITGRTEIASGTFHGMSIETAVKKLLQMRKRSMNAVDMVVDLRAGGLHLQSDTPTNTVTSVLTRAFNNGSDIVRVRRGMWGLQEWYPTQRFKRSGSDE